MRTILTSIRRLSLRSPLWRLAPRRAARCAGPGFFNWNVGLSRTFLFAERYSFQVRGEAFNLTNTPFFGNPGLNVSTVTTSNGVQNLNGFGVISSASNQRTMRFSGRFSF